MLKIFCDGSITGSHWAKKDQKDSPAYGWSGWVIYREDGSVLHHHSLALGTADFMSANIAEYMAVRSALRWCARDHRSHALQVHSDSQLVMQQLSGEYNVHNDRLLKLRDHVRTLAALYPRVTYAWIRREQNRYADYMSKVLQNGGTIPPVPVPDEVIVKRR